MAITRHAVVALVAVITTACTPDLPRAAGAEDPDAHAPVDATDAFTVIGYAPEGGATEVARNANVTVTFSEDVDPASVTSSTFSVRDGRGERVEGTLVVDEATITFTPRELAPILEQFTVVITVEVSSVDGEALDREQYWIFTMRDAAWGDAAQIGTSSEWAQGPRLAVDRSGHALALWHDRSAIWSNHYVPGDGWARPVAAHAATGQTLSVDVAFDVAGNATAVWQQMDADLTNIWAGRFTAATGEWSGVTRIETSDLGHAQLPRVAIDGYGNVIAVWQQHDGTRLDVWANHYVDGWGTATMIDTSADDAQLPRVAVDSSGNAIVAWVQFDGVRSSLWARRYVAGYEWGPAESIESDHVGNAVFPQVVSDQTGNAVVVWSQSGGGESWFNIWAARYTIDGGWETAQVIDAANAGHASEPQVAIDGAGNVVVVWRQRDGSTSQVASNRLPAGGDWAGVTLLDDDVDATTPEPRLALDRFGNGLAVWNWADDEQETIRARRYLATSGWQPATSIENHADGNVGLPQVGLDDSGYAVVIWGRANEVGTFIEANTFR